MSLLDFIKRPDVREVLDTVIPKAPRAVDAMTLVPSVAPDASLIGAAFDYALRFELMRLNPEASQEYLVAEIAALKAPSTAQISKQRLDAAESAVKRYLRLAEPPLEAKQEIATHSLLLSQLDIVARTGKTEHLATTPTSTQAQEVVALVEAVPDSMRKPRRLVLNPKFGKYSLLVGGADADLIVDDMVVELKTTKQAVVEKWMIRQAIGYLILARAYGFEEIRRPAIYVSRAAHLWVLPGTLVDDPKYPGAEEAFLRIARQAGAERLAAVRRRRSRRRDA